MRLITYKELLDRKKALVQPMIRWPVFLQEPDLYRERKVSPKFQNQVVLLYSILPKVALQPNQTQEASQAQYSRYDLDVRPVAIRDYLANKINQNLGIFGSSGGGKSRLFRWLLELFSDKARIVLSPKPNDEALKAGIPVIDARAAIQSPWKDPDAFAQSFVVALHQKIRAGIQLQPIRTFLKEICQETADSKEPSWKTFTEILQKKKRLVTKNQLETLSNIEVNMPRIIIETGEAPVEIGDESVVLDFSKITDVDARTLWLEYFLRAGCWNRIQNGTLSDVIICVDEGHLITRQESSIIHEMSKEIRHRGAIWIVTQGLFELRPETSQNLATKLCFRTGTEDLDIAKKINEILRHTLSQLSSYEWIDLEWPRFAEYVPVFRYVKPNVDDKQPIPSRLEPKALLRGVSRRTGEGGGVAAGEERKERPVIAEEEVVSRLPQYEWVIIKELATQKSIDFESMKFPVSQVLKRLYKTGSVGKIRLVEYPNQRAFMFYYLRGDQISQLHEAIQRRAKSRISKLYEIEEAPRNAFMNPDLQTRDGSLIVEIETGLSNGQVKRLKDRLATALQKTGKVALVIVPNEGERGSYKEYLDTFITDYPNRIKVLTLLELRHWVDELSNSQQALARGVQQDEEKGKGEATEAV